jgi:hypothetical protein
MAAPSATNGEKTHDDKYRKKLTKVLSTKLSIEDYNKFQKYTNGAYEARVIEKPEVSNTYDIL